MHKNMTSGSIDVVCGQLSYDDWTWSLRRYCARL